MPDHRAKIRQVLWITLLLNLFVMSLKAVVGFATGSLSLQADALHSVTDSINNVLGLTLSPIEEKIVITPEIEKILKQRDQARKDKNWALSDQLRDQLKELGYQVQDKKSS